MSHVRDVIIFGATAAGYAAAYTLAKNGLDVLVVEAPHQAVECPLSDWTPAEFFRLKGLPASLARNAKAAAFHRVCYHNATLEKQVQYASRSRIGYFVRMGNLVGALRRAAEKAGAKTLTVKKTPRMELKEDYVLLGTSRPLLAKLLLAAQDRPEAVLRELAQPLRAGPPAPLVVAALDVPLDGRKLPASLAGALHVVESAERSELGLFFAVNSMLHLRIVSTSSAAGMRAAELSAMVSGLQEHELLPKNLAIGKAVGAVWYPPGGAALEMETHVAKRCLLIGTAGGFVDTITGHSLYPSVKSALLAAQTAIAATASPDVQEKLSGYKNSWRKGLADYLRPPNTSLQMLLPLLFVNHRIVARFTMALLAGATI